MKIYFIRHGESELNALDIHQYKNTKLSKNGIEQAKTVARRFKNIPIDIILSSPYIRTRQTAEEINRVIKKDILYTDLLRETKRPSELEGKHTKDDYALTIKKQIKLNRGNKNWHFSDEDNFYDIKKRVSAFLNFLNALKEENILAVTHGTILRYILCSMMLGENYDPQYFEKINHFYKTDNTGISIFIKQQDRWKLLSWNDHSHLL